MNAIIALSLLGIFTLFTGIFNWRKAMLPIVVIGLAGVFVLNGMDYFTTPSWYADYTHMVIFDRYAVVFSAALIMITAMLFFLCKQYYQKEDNNISDIYGLILFTLVGGMLMASFSNFAMLFLGIEILSIPLYILAGTKRLEVTSNEASIKYFLMGSFSTGFLLFGMALVYGAAHTFTLDGIRQYTDAHAGDLPTIFVAGIMLMLVGMLFKVSGAPFHFWAPDVYSGAPTLITTFMATVVKTAAFAALYRLLFYTFGSAKPIWFDALWGVAALTMIIGNFSALYQHGVKRMLAYSSISNAGYLLIGVIAMNTHSANSIFYYTLVYSLASLVSFGVLMLVTQDNGGDDSYTAFKGLARNNPALAGLMTLAMLSLAGIPPLAGFFGKYYIFINAMENGYIYIVLIAVANSLVGIYYYFKVIVAMFAKDTAPTKIAVQPAYLFALVVAAALLFVLGIFPDWVSGLMN
ncbi:MAG: NADH-quinone oxidoreductase subunit N [Bacteroidetes bacterium]|nr:NADH-quinone oxidoreductase subunit N [Bacteroidota bacterium]